MSDDTLYRKRYHVFMRKNAAPADTHTDDDADNTYDEDENDDDNGD